MFDLSMNGLLDAGFTKKMAKCFLDALETEKRSGMWSEASLEWAHSRGFLAESVATYSLIEENTECYLSDYDYFRIWPLNSWERIWINDKLTLKYMLAGTPYDVYMPKYYFYKAKNALRPLLNCPIGYKNGFTDDLISLLKEVGKIACKPCNGSLSAGFFQMDYVAEKVYINGEEQTNESLEEFVKIHENYIYTEFFYPSADMAKIFPLIHTVRVLVITEMGHEPKIAGAYMRFGTKDSGYANYMTNTSNTKYVYDVDVDVDTGNYGEGKAVYMNHIADMPFHPDSGVLVEGHIDLWNEARNMVIGIAHYLNACEYMGFDICFTDKGVKIMEINSHSGIKHLQMRKPLLQEEWSRAYYQKKMDDIDSMIKEDKHQRNQIVR